MEEVTMEERIEDAKEMIGGWFGNLQAMRDALFTNPKLLDKYDGELQGLDVRLKTLYIQMGCDKKINGQYKPRDQNLVEWYKTTSKNWGQTTSESPIGLEDATSSHKREPGVSAEKVNEADGTGEPAAKKRKLETSQNASKIDVGLPVAVADFSDSDDEYAVRRRKRLPTDYTPPTVTSSKMIIVLDTRELTTQKLGTKWQPRSTYIAKDTIACSPVIAQIFKDKKDGVIHPDDDEITWHPIISSFQKKFVKHQTLYLDALFASRYVKSGKFWTDGQASERERHQAFEAWAHWAKTGCLPASTLRLDYDIAWTIGKALGTHDAFFKLLTKGFWKPPPDSDDEAGTARTV